MRSEPYLDHVQVATPPACEQQARRFYGGVLGFTEVAKPAPLDARGGLWFALGGGATGAQLHIGMEEDFRAARKAHPAFGMELEALEALAGRLAGAQHPVRWSDELPHLRRFFTDDPWGNRLEFLARAG